MTRPRPAGPPVVVTVDRDACMGAQECMEVAPGVFRPDDAGKATVHDPAAADLDTVIEAARRCPNFAITVEVGGERRAGA